MPMPSPGSGFAFAGGRSRAARCIALFLLSGLLLPLLPARELYAQSAPAYGTITAGPHAEWIAEAAQRFDIPEHWILAVLRQESAGDIAAVSSAGAMGLMQIMPATWEMLRARYALGDDPFDPRDNIMAGAAYLRLLLDRYGNPAAMLAAYNAGPGRYDEYLLAGRDLPDETRAYVAALAPLLDDPGAVAALGTLPIRTSDWREAALLAPPGAEGIAGSLQPDGRSGGQRPSDEELESGAADTGSSGLFVARSGPGSPKW